MHSLDCSHWAILDDAMVGSVSRFINEYCGWSLKNINPSSARSDAI
jgi:hypothetical protein